MSFDLGAIGINSIRKAVSFLTAAKADSLVDYTQVARVEPICMISADCLYLESLPAVQQSALSLFAGYYLQAVAISATVGKVSVFKTLDKINPNRSPSGAVIDGADTWLLAQESYKHRLPYYGDPRNQKDIVALEAMSRDEIAEQDLQLKYQTYELNNDKFYHDKHMKEDDVKRRILEADRTYEMNLKKFDADRANELRREQLEKDKIFYAKYRDRVSDKFNQDRFDFEKKRHNDEMGRSNIGFGKDTIKTLSELADLSVGKIFNVEITDGMHQMTLPVSIRLMASAIPSGTLAQILSMGSEDTSVKERYHGWKSGRLEFIRDIILCQDLIDQHRKNLMDDKSGIYNDILKRNRSNQLTTLLSGTPSVATASNIAIISTDVAEEIEASVNGRLKDFKTRQQIFKKTYLMILIVIDKQFDRVTFYHRGINHATELGVRDLKANNRGSGPDVSEILRAYQLGSAPSL